MGWRILVNFIRQPMLKLKAHSGFHDLFLKQTSPLSQQQESFIIASIFFRPSKIFLFVIYHSEWQNTVKLVLVLLH